MNIQFKQCNSKNYNKGRSSQIKYIVIHYTANSNDTSFGNATYFANNIVNASAHYFVDSTSIFQSVDCDSTAWHCGGALQGSANKNYGIKSYHGICTNSNSIGIEHCSVRAADGSYYFKDETIANGIWLVKMLMGKYNIPIENVIRHYDVTFKRCPAPLLPLEKWANYLAMIQGDELTVSQYNELDNRVKTLESKSIYNKISDVPEWGRPVIQKMINKKLILGNESGLGLTEDLVKICVINDRAGLYGK